MSKTAKVKPIKSRDEIYAALVEQRNITDTFNQALAREVVDALVRGDLAEAVRALALLPPVVRTDSSSRMVSSEQARAKLFEMVMNARAADQVEDERTERTAEIAATTHSISADAARSCNSGARSGHGAVRRRPALAPPSCAQTSSVT